MADVEAALLDYLTDLGYTVTTTPLDLESRLPVIRVRRIGGPGDRENDFPRVSVQSFAAPTSGAPRAHFDLAQQVETRMLDETPAYIDGTGVCLDDVAKDSGPVELTYPNPSVRVAESIFRLTIRR